MKHHSRHHKHHTHQYVPPVTDRPHYDLPRQSGIKAFLSRFDSTVLTIIGITVLLFSGILVWASMGGSGEKPKAIAVYASSDKEKPIASPSASLFDYGTISVKEQATTTITITNAGTKPLQLYNVNSSCGCTVATLTVDKLESKEFGMHTSSEYVALVPPNGTAILKIMYRPYVMPTYGSVSRTITVATNDPAKPQLTFVVKANVK